MAKDFYFGPDVNVAAVFQMVGHRAQVVEKRKPPGESGLYRVPTHGEPELVLAGAGLVGVAFDPRGGIVVCSNETAYRLAA